jgi:uncharacterized iron-regulated membrane protein
MKPRFRRLLRWVHFWLALLCGAIVALVGVTGSLYVFEPEINAWLNAEYYQTQGQSVIYADDIAVAAAIEKAAGNQVQSLQWPGRQRQTYLFKVFDDHNWYFFDHTSGEIKSNGGAYTSPLMATIYEIHSNLLLGEAGRYITATASLVLALLMLGTGLWLWWPARFRWRQMKAAFTPQLANKARHWFDLHRLSGVYFALPLLIMGLTGGYFIYHDPMQKFINLLTFSQSPDYDWRLRLQAQQLPGKPRDPLSLSDSVRVMRQYYPGLYPRNLWRPAAADDTLSLAYQASTNPQPGAQYRVFAKANPYTGEKLAAYDPVQLDSGERFVANWLLPLHLGEFGGLLTRILWFIGGLVPAVLFISGVRLWWRRR